MNVRALGFASTFVIAAVAVACGGSGRRSGFEQDVDPTLAADTDDESTGGFVGGGDPGKGADCHINNAGGDPDKDYDGDGFPLKYDCNECDATINPGAYDIPGNGIDEDCNGVVDDEEVDCDDSIAIDTTDPFDAARALGLCKKASAGGGEWGVIEASWVKPDGQQLPNTSRAQLGHGVLPDFGVNVPQAGASMLALSSGYARARNQPDFASGTSQRKGYSSGTPTGYPKPAPACPGVGTEDDSNDGVGLLVKIRVPTNANSFSYQQFFLTHEYSTYVCTSFNDSFVTMLNPIPEGLPDGNIAFDNDGNPISVNNSLLQTCKPGTHKGITYDCPLGTGPLEGTGFESGGGTGWLTTVAPVKAGTEISLLFTLWDQGDAAWDSTVLLDDFQWSVEGAEAAETKPSGPK